ncbi:hypothetical protein B0O99DRAFT_745712 [Bisporella sp. PMI_857]|nr:hypothetical protein B0O99DRAFT_745712 [Bisporella sp. PMI_857]
MVTLNACQDCPRLEVVKRGTGVDGWETTELSSDALHNLLEQHSMRSNVILIIAQADKVRECLGCRQIFKNILKIPEFWWSPWCKRANGYFGCEDTADAQGKFDGQNTWFRFLIKQTFQNAPEGQKDYLWYKFNVFTRWIASTNQNVLLVFDPRSAIKERLPHPLLDSLDASEFGDPYWIHSLFAEEVVRLQDEAVWGIRNLVRQIEIERSTSTAPNPDYPRLHDIARHAIHVSETLDLAVKTVECMMEQHDEFTADRPTTDEKTKNARRRIRKHLKFCRYMIGSLRSRSTSNQQRLLNEIQLAFNTVAQYDARISVDIGYAAQKDSSAMKTISFLTMTFFPATFISAIFSMSFFSFNPDTDEWTVSGKFWVYWAVAIPITGITAGLWSLWHKFFPPRRIGEEKLQLRGTHLAKREMKELATRLTGYSEDQDGLSKV